MVFFRIQVTASADAASGFKLSFGITWLSGWTRHVRIDGLRLRGAGCQTDQNSAGDKKLRNTLHQDPLKKLALMRCP